MPYKSAPKHGASVKYSTDISAAHPALHYARLYVKFQGYDAAFRI
jgi:hypothetical protein